MWTVHRAGHGRHRRLRLHDLHKPRHVPIARRPAGGVSFPRAASRPWYPLRRTGAGGSTSVRLALGAGCSRLGDAASGCHRSSATRLLRPTARPQRTTVLVADRHRWDAPSIIHRAFGRWHGTTAPWRQATAARQMSASAPHHRPGSAAPSRRWRTSALLWG